MKPIPRLHFAHLPTVIEELPRLSEALGGPRILVKRDDQTGLAFGGNKTRKLEFLVAEAREQGKRTLISGGAIQSNHCRQTAAAAARFGFDCTLVLTGERPEHPSARTATGCSRKHSIKRWRRRSSPTWSPMAAPAPLEPWVMRLPCKSPWSS